MPVGFEQKMLLERHYVHMSRELHLHAKQATYCTLLSNEEWGPKG